METAFCQRVAQGSRFFGVVGAALGEGVERGVGGVAEGAQHACHIFEWRLLGAAFGEAAGGFAFEVEDDVVAAGAKDLAEMVVAMDADALAGVGGRGGGDGTGAGEELDAAAEDEGGVVGGGFSEMGHAALECGEGEGELSVDAVGVGDEVGGREALGEKAGLWVGVARARCISAVRRPRRAAASR